MKDFGIGNSKFGMEIHENFIPHDALCSTGESLYYNFDYDTNQGIVVHHKVNGWNFESFKTNLKICIHPIIDCNL